MGARAIIVVRDETGHERRFRAGWASKQFQIPHLARFVHTADLAGTALNVAGYLDYVATHPHTLPRTDITDVTDVTDGGGRCRPDGLGDLDHRYELWLSQAEYTFRYQVYDRIRGEYRDTPGWRRSEDLASRAQLYEAAARMCRTMAASTNRFARRNGGVIPADWPTSLTWRDQARTFTTWLATTDRRLLHQAFRANDPGDAAVPDWFTVRTARTQARRIGALLREHYPDVRIRIRIGADATISLTVPVQLATEAEAAGIADTIGALLGQQFTADVRPRRRSRFSPSRQPPH